MLQIIISSGLSLKKMENVNSFLLSDWWRIADGINRHRLPVREAVYM